MTNLTWEQRKQIGEALKWHVREEVDTFDLWQGKAFWDAFPTEQEAWDAYQPDVLGEVIPWLERNAVTWDCGMHQMGTYGASAVLGPQTMVTVGRDVGYETHGEAVCALMLAVIESGVPE